MNRFSPRQPLYLGSEVDETGFSAADANLGGKAGHILSWAVTLIAISFVVARIALSLVAGR